MPLHTWCRQGPCNPSSCATFMLNPHWSRAASGKKKYCIYACRVTSVMSNSLRHCGLWLARLLCRVGFSRQEYWSVLANTGFHSLLEHYISCCPSCQLPCTLCCQNPCDPRLCTTFIPGPNRGNPSPPGQPQKQNPVDDPHEEVEMKPQLKPRGSVAKEDPKPSHQLYKLQIKSTKSTRQTLCPWNI